jgi:hypothetical protein
MFVYGNDPVLFSQTTILETIKNVYQNLYLNQISASAAQDGTDVNLYHITLSPKSGSTVYSGGSIVLDVHLARTIPVNSTYYTFATSVTTNDTLTGFTPGVLNGSVSIDNYNAMAFMPGRMEVNVKYMTTTTRAFSKSKTGNEAIETVFAKLQYLDFSLNKMN